MFPRLIQKINPAGFLWTTAAILTALVAVRTIARTPFSVDSYTHLAIGRFVLDQGTVPRHTDLSFKSTDPSLEWISHSWLGDAMLYLPFSVHPVFGVYVLLIPVLILCIYLVLLLLKDIAPKSTRFLAVGTAVICSLGFWRYHPFLFIVPMQLLLMNLLQRWRRHPLIPWSIPILFLMWANVSGGTIAIPLVYVILFAVIAFVSRTANNLHLLAVLAASFVATIANPYGTRVLVYTLTTIAVVSQNRSFASLTGAINTLNQTYNKQQFSSMFLALCIVYILTLIISFLAVFIRKYAPLKPVVHLLPSLLFVPLSFFWVRFIPITVFTTAPLWIWSVHHIWKRYPIPPRRLAGTTAAIAGNALLLFILLKPPILPHPQTPNNHIERIREFSLPANILTTYDLTGYAMYMLPSYKTMLDAQDDLLSDESLVSIYQPTGDFSHAFDTVAQQLTVSTALVSRTIGGLAATLSASNTWKLLYIDEHAALFVRASGMEASFFRDHEIRSLKLETNLGFDPDERATAAAELELLHTRYPDNMLFLGQLATLYRMQKKFNAAETLFTRIPQTQWGFALYTEYGRLMAAQGKCIKAESHFLKALSYRDEKNYSRTVLDLAVLYAGCFKDTVRAKHYFIRYNSFLITTSEREKLHMLAKQFGIDMTQ